MRQRSRGAMDALKFCLEDFPCMRRTLSAWQSTCSVHCSARPSRKTWGPGEGFRILIEFNDSSVVRDW
jgi:hypothetical protein